MGDTAALQAAWSGLSGTTVAKLRALNATMVAGAASDLSVQTLFDFVKNSGKLAGITAFATNPPATPDATALLAANYLLVVMAGGAGATIPAASVASLLAILDNISADARTGATAANVTAFNNICMPVVPWWQAHGFTGPVTLFDLIGAGNLS